MKVLIACEESQIVCKAFRARGHEAYSCDLQDCSGGHPEWHIKGDVLGLLDEFWDLVIAHPVCTYLTVSANSWLKDQPPRKSGVLVGKERRDAVNKAAEFFMRFVNCKCARWAIENPIGVMSSRYRKPDQTIHPWMFGHPEKKATCLWLKNLPKLVPTKIVELPKLKPGQSKRSLNKLDHLPQSPDRAKLRSKTFQGIADAMAEQWGNPENFDRMLL